MLAPSMGEAARPAWTHAACADVECGDTNGDCCAQRPARASTCDVEMVDAENTTPNSIITKDVMDTFATMAEILRQLHGAKIGGDAKNRQSPKKTTSCSLPEDLDIIKETWERAAGIENTAPAYPTPAEAIARARLSERKRHRRRILKQGARYAPGTASIATCTHPSPPCHSAHRLHHVIRTAVFVKMAPGLADKIMPSSVSAEEMEAVQAFTSILKDSKQREADMAALSAPAAIESVLSGLNRRDGRHKHWTVEQDLELLGELSLIVGRRAWSAIAKIKIAGHASQCATAKCTPVQLRLDVLRGHFNRHASYAHASYTHVNPLMFTGHMHHTVCTHILHMPHITCLLCTAPYPHDPSSNPDRGPNPEPDLTLTSP